MTTVAIDFGTSNTVVSFLEADNSEPKLLRFPQISRVYRIKKGASITEVPLVPSLVFIKDPSQRILGEKVRSLRLGLAQPERLFKAFKRDLATDYQPPDRVLDGYSYSSVMVAELFIKEIWQEIINIVGQPDKLVFTVPVGAYERYLDWFRDLAHRLGVSQVYLVDESTAAGLGYAQTRSGSVILVIDFGGGTLDLSLVRTQTSSQKAIKAQVIAKSDAYVGGEDIDIWIVEDYLRQIGSSREAIGNIGWQNLLEIAEKLKIRLTKEESASESWLDEESFMSYEVKLSRQQLENILENQQFLEQLRRSLDEVLAISLGQGISKNEISQVFLVGGSCLIPCVQQLVISYFGKQKVSLDKPFEAVCYGGLALVRITEIEDYLHHSYAIRVWEPLTKSYSYFTLFEKGTKYPCKRSESLILQVATPQQTEIRLDIGEVAETMQSEVTYDQSGRMTSGRLDKHTNYRSLEGDRQQVCLAHLNPPGILGQDRIKVDFEVDAGRVLLATVWDLATGQVLVEKGAIALLK